MLRKPRSRTMLAGLVLAIGLLSAPRVVVRTQEPASQNPSFRAGASAVVLDVVIRDKRGRPVRDIQRGEVTVLEDGVAREIRSFRLVERTATTPGTGLSQTPPKTGGESLPDPLRYPTLVTLVFDHLTQNSRTLARRA